MGGDGDDDCDDGHAFGSDAACDLDYLFGEIKREEIDIEVAPDDLRRASKTFSWRTSYGTDTIHPRQLAMLSDDVLWMLIGIMHAMVASSSDNVSESRRCCHCAPYT